MALSPTLTSLADLGVTHVEPMPVAEFAGDRGWGIRWYGVICNA